jgi:hypothetical protein
VQRRAIDADAVDEVGARLDRELVDLPVPGLGAVPAVVGAVDQRDVAAARPHRDGAAGDVDRVLLHADVELGRERLLALRVGHDGPRVDVGVDLQRERAGARVVAGAGIQHAAATAGREGSAEEHVREDRLDEAHADRLSNPRASLATRDR